jgi:hypothetical protein
MYLHHAVIQFNSTYIYINRSLIIWYSKAKGNVEASTFGFKFIALCIGTELLFQVYTINCASWEFHLTALQVY